LVIDNLHLTVEFGVKFGSLSYPLSSKAIHRFRETTVERHFGLRAYRLSKSEFLVGEFMRIGDIQMNSIN